MAKRKEIPSLTESAMETALRRLKELAERFERFRKDSRVQDQERDKQLGLMEAEFAHILMMAVNWDTIAQMDPLGMSRIIEIIPVGTWTAIFKRVGTPHVRKILMGLGDANRDIVAEILNAYKVEKFADLFEANQALANRIQEAIERARARW
jgi:hypothetical protein